MDSVSIQGWHIDGYNVFVVEPLKHARGEYGGKGERGHDLVGEVANFVDMVGLAAKRRVKW